MIITLPVLLNNKIDTIVSEMKNVNHRIMASKIKQFLHHLYCKSENVSGLLGEPIGIESKEMKKRLGDDYRGVITLLKSESIIEVNEYSSKEAGICKKYWLDPSFIDGGLVNIDVKPKLTDFIQHKTLEILTGYDIDIDAAKNIISTIIDDPDRLLRKVKRQDCITQECFNKVRLYSRKGEGISRWNTLDLINKKTLLDSYNEDGDFELLKHNKRYYFVPIDVFLTERRRQVAFSYNHTVARFAEKDFFCSLDDNGRLYHNIVNMPNCLLPAVSAEGVKLMDWDIKCSQFVFFVHCCMNPNLDNIVSQYVADNKIDIGTDDFNEFKETVRSGELYNLIAKKVGLNKREEGKELCFEIIFGKNTKTKNRQIMKELFPTVIEITQGVKNKHGYKSLPNSLQQTEASILVNNVLYQLQKQHNVTSKHDSFLYPISNDKIATRIEEIVTNVLGNIYSYSINSY